MKPAAERTEGGIRLFVRAQPKASRDAIEAAQSDAGGQKWLKVRVTAPADKGAANERITALLASAFRRPKAAIRLKSGDTGRQKIFEISGEPEALLAAAASLARTGRAG